MPFSNYSHSLIMADGRLFLAFRSPAEIWTVALRLSVPGVQIRSPAKIEQLRYYWRLGFRSPAKIEQLRYYWRLGSRSPVEIWTVALRSSVPGVQISEGKWRLLLCAGRSGRPPTRSRRSAAWRRSATTAAAHQTHTRKMMPPILLY